MGDKTKKSMNWLKTKHKQFMQSKFLVFILGIIIASSLTVCYYEGKDLKHDYDQSMKIWEEHLTRKHIDELSRELNQRNKAPKNEIIPREVDGQLVDISDIVRRILILESSNGKNNYSNYINNFYKV